MAMLRLTASMAGSSFRALVALMMLALMASAARARADAGVGYDKEVALVIGISKYRRPWKPLPNATKDAQDFAKLMTARGLSPRTGTLLSLYDHEATEKGIHAAFKKALAVASGTQGQERTLLTVYFAGHGEDGFIIPYGASDESGYISMSQLKKWAKPSNGIRHQIFILGSCFSGTLFRSSAISNRDLATFDRRPARWFRSNLKRVTRIGLAAGTDEQIIPDGKKGYGSLFGQAVVRALSKVPGSRYSEGDENKDGCVSSLELAAYVNNHGSQPDWNTPYYGPLPGDEQGLVAYCDRILPEPGARAAATGPLRGIEKPAAGPSELGAGPKGTVGGPSGAGGTKQISSAALPRRWEAKMTIREVTLYGGATIDALQRNIPVSLRFVEDGSTASFRATPSTSCFLAEITPIEFTGAEGPIRFQMECLDKKCLGEKLVWSGRIERPGGGAWRLAAQIEPFADPQRAVCSLPHAGIVAVAK